jgi:hypothetical protein
VYTHLKATPYFRVGFNTIPSLYFFTETSLTKLWDGFRNTIPSLYFFTENLVASV